MQDLYKVLGVKQDASLREIKKAYRSRALESHPDKKDGDHDYMTLLNEAYSTFSDLEKRKQYDQDWETYADTCDEELSSDPITNFLSPHGKPYSDEFKKQHQALSRGYQLKPLKTGSVLPWFTSFKPELCESKNATSSLYIPDDYQHNAQDIFSLLRSKPWACKARLPKKLFTQELSAETVVPVFISFLQGHYYGNTLESINAHISAEIKKAAYVYAPEKALCEGILEIMTTTTASRKGIKLLRSIGKITDCANKLDTLKFHQVVPLLHNQYFRNLYAYALHLYWQDNKTALLPDNLQSFNGQVETKHVLNELVEKLTGGSVNQSFKSSLRELIQFIKLLYQFEKAVNDGVDEQTAEHYRKKAFHILDWSPAFTGKAGPKIMINMLLQVGIYLQRAASREKVAAIAMADEKLALQMYLTTFGIGHHTTPDIESYALTQSLKYIAAFRFRNPELENIIPALQERALILADILPFFDPPQTNVSLFNQGNDALKLMRNYLHSLVTIIECNKKSRAKKIPLDHDNVTVLYQAYEACLKGWYEEGHNAEVEQKLRLDLMEALLLEKRWSFTNVEENMAWPWVMIDRDKNGWMKPTRTLAFPQDPRIEKFTSLEGFEINYKTGEISILLHRWDDHEYPHHQAFVLFDLHEMIAKNLKNAIFSLDPVDPNKPYHPFNAIRFAPDNLHKTELLNTMLLTDYMLKFLTVNREVQGNHPYTLRPAEQMIKHLPRYLRNIITAYHGEQSTGALHRFWIEAEDIDVFMPDEKSEVEGFEKVILGEPRMVVKKHRMKRDINGNLVDTDEDEEGWPIYVFTHSRQCDVSYEPFQKHAMVFITRENKFYFLEYGEVTHTFLPKNYREMLNRLSNQPRERDGRVKPSKRNAHLLYRLTKKVTAQAGLPNRYSPEFIFAHEFTRHYDEFALYLPEFARLKQLSKILTMVNLMNGIRSGNKDSLQALNYLLSHSRQKPPTTEIYQKHEENYNQNHRNIASQLRKLSAELKYSILLSKWLAEL